jgi:hypothetical protein
MADPNIQTLIYPLSIGPGLIKTYQTDVNKQTGSSVTYDISNLGQKDAVWKSEREVSPDGKVFYRANPVQSSYYENLSDAEKKFIQTDVAYQADNQRAAFIQTNYTQDQINNLFPNMPKVQNTAAPALATSGGTTIQQTADPDVTAAVQNPDPINIDSPKSLGRTDFGEPLYYPLDLASNKQDRIIFTLKEIVGSTIKASFTESSITRKTSQEEIKGQVTLPIQPSISDNNSVDWSGGSLNAIDSYVAAASFTLMNKPGAKALAESMQQILGDIAKEAKSQSSIVKLFLAQEAAGIQGLLSRATGAVLNPNLELLFNGPQLRPFNFTFRLSPRESTEATAVRKIIRFFKEAMSVRTTESNVFLKSPFVFDIKYQAYDDNGALIDHPSINRIKTCALLSCDVDYTPDGSYMTFTDGSRTMTSYQISLRFSEIDPIYSTDYTGNNIPTDHIGY